MATDPDLSLMPEADPDRSVPYTDDKTYQRGLSSPDANAPYVFAGEPIQTDDWHNAPATDHVPRPTVPLIGTTPYPGEIVDARTITLAAGARESVGGSGNPSGGYRIIVIPVSGNAEIMPSGVAGASSLPGFPIGAPGATGVLSLDVAALTLRGVSASSTVGVIVIANSREY